MNELVKTAAEQLAAVLQKWERNALIRASGHAPDLKVLAFYLGEQQRRLDECELRIAELERRAPE